MVGHEILIVEEKLTAIKKVLEQTEAEIRQLVSKRKDLNKQAETYKSTINALKSRQLHQLNQKDIDDFPWSSSIRKTAEKTFCITSFRPLQLETMNATLSNLDCIVIMPTGGGKSLCYQLPAIITEGITLVITPLVSLMEDQCFQLDQLSISNVCLNANSPKELVNSVHADMVKQNSNLRLVYVTPEKIAKSKRFMNKLEACYAKGNLKRIAIDEVHCCSQWGHDFRPDYKILGILKRQFPKVPLLGLTATASSDLLVDVQQILNIPHAQVYRSSFNRPNLKYSILPKSSKFDTSVCEIAEFILANHHGSSGIVYCLSRKDAENVAKSLKGRGISAGCYHADLPAAMRSRVHSLWIKNDVKVIVATIAFGMGIDKPDVRFVLHHSMSKSLENYYQESGRAGRDGRPADCVLFFNLSDYFRQSCMVFTEKTGLEKLYGIVSYAVNTTMCRRKIIASHFSEVWQEDMECSKMCDICEGDISMPTLNLGKCHSDAERILAVLDGKTAENRWTGKMLLDNLFKKSTPGTSSLNRQQTESLIVHMLIHQNLREDFHFTPYSTISYLLVSSRNLSHYLSQTPTTRSPEASCTEKAYSSKRSRKSGDSHPTRSKKNKRESGNELPKTSNEEEICTNRVNGADNMSEVVVLGSSSDEDERPIL